MGMTYRQFLFLVTLESRGEVSSGKLADLLGVSKAAVSQRVGWFHERGLVRLGHPDSDHRVLTVALTPAGEEQARQAADFLEHQFRDSFRGLSHIHLDELNDTLSEVLRHLSTPRQVSQVAA